MLNISRLVDIIHANGRNDPTLLTPIPTCSTPVLTDDQNSTIVIEPPVTDTIDEQLVTPIHLIARKLIDNHNLTFAIETSGLKLLQATSFQQITNLILPIVVDTINE